MQKRERSDQNRDRRAPLRLYGIFNGLLRRHNVDIYITGSNSRFLSTDVMTEFRGRGDEVRVYPLSFAEFFSVYDGDKYDAFGEYSTYGGLPLILPRATMWMSELLPIPKKQGSKAMHPLHAQSFNDTPREGQDRRFL